MVGRAVRQLVGRLSVAWRVSLVWEMASSRWGMLRRPRGVVVKRYSVWESILCGNLTVKRVESLAAPRAASSSWDDLWRRCRIAPPTARAALVELWCESFAPAGSFCAYVLEENGKALAALPLVQQRWMGLKTWKFPANFWSAAGDLLIDAECDAQRVFASSSTLATDCGSLILFDAVPTSADRWRAFLLCLSGLAFRGSNSLARRSTWWKSATVPSAISSRDRAITADMSVVHSPEPKRKGTLTLERHDHPARRRRSSIACLFRD